MAYFCGRLHSRFGDKRDGENENEKKRVWQVAFAPEVAALQRERERERVIEIQVRVVEYYYEDLTRGSSMVSVLDLIAFQSFPEDREIEK